MINFFLKWRGKYLDYDGVYGNQCVDVTKQYFRDVLEVPVFKGNAIDYWTNPPLGFEKIAKTWFNRPNPGDIIIWGTTYTSYGHIAICNWSRFFDLGVFSQNDPVGSYCDYKIYDYKHIVGWLRPPKPLQIAFIGSKQPLPEDFMKKVREYTPEFKFEAVYYPKEISVPSGTLTTSEAMTVIDELDVKEKFVFIFYSSPNAAYEVASYHPQRNASFATIPHGNPLTVPVHAFLHLLRKYINANHLGYVEDREYYPTTWADLANFDNPGWRFQEQYNEIKPYLIKIK